MSEHRDSSDPPKGAGGMAEPLKIRTYEQSVRIETETKYKKEAAIASKLIEEQLRAHAQQLDTDMLRRLKRDIVDCIPKSVLCPECDGMGTVSRQEGSLSRPPCPMCQGRCIPPIPISEFETDEDIPV